MEKILPVTNVQAIRNQLKSGLGNIEEQTRRLQESLDRSSAGIEGIVGQCKAMQELLAAMQKATLEVPELEPESALDEPDAPNDAAGQVQVELCSGAENFEQKGPGLGCTSQGSEVVLPTETLTLREVRDRVEKGMISAAVGNCRGNMAKASELLGVSRPALYDLMKKHGLFKQGARQ